MVTSRLISIRITNPDYSSQLMFAKDAMSRVEFDSVHAEATREGLILSALWDLPLDLACDKLKEHFPYIKIGNPYINYVDDTEPYVNVEVQISKHYLGDVLGDLNRRGAHLNRTDKIGNAYCIYAEAPLSEVFGYTGHLRDMTNGNGRFQVLEYTRYLPISRGGGPGFA